MTKLPPITSPRRMRLPMNRFLAVAAATAILATPMVAAAQAPASHQGGGMHAGGMQEHAMHHGGTMMGGMPFQHVEGRLAFLRAELKVTPAQEPQWTKFADAVRGVAKDVQSMMQQMPKGGSPVTTAPDILARYEKMLTLRLDAVRKVKGDFDPLYGVLSDDQKRVADELLASPMSIM